MFGKIKRNYGIRIGGGGYISVRHQTFPSFSIYQEGAFFLFLCQLASERRTLIDFSESHYGFIEEVNELLPPPPPPAPLARDSRKGQVGGKRSSSTAVVVDPLNLRLKFAKEKKERKIELKGEIDIIERRGEKKTHVAHY